MSSIKRNKRTRKKINAVSDRPRLCVYRSNKYVYAQVITRDGKTVFGLVDKSINVKDNTRLENAKSLGLAIAKKALDKKIKSVVFDKGRFAYHGKIKAVAEGAREGGLDF